MVRFIISVSMAVLLSGCVFRTKLQTHLSAATISTVNTEQALKNGLMDAFTGAENPQTIKFKVNPSDSDVTIFLRTGFTLTDIYCDTFFRQTNQAFRRRKFGRGATNDVGTVVSAILGLSNVGAKTVSGVATGFGLADSGWRNYDESFVVSPELDLVRSLVTAAQDKFRKDSFESLPHDYMTARSTIVRYAGICSFLGMQTLLNQSASSQKEALEKAALTLNVAAPAPKPGSALNNKSVTEIKPAATVSVVPVGP
jgi:hypothetical protein